MNESIVFFGSGPVAASSLALLARTFTIEAVVTKPRPPHHHGSVPVLELAQQLRLPVLEVVNKKTVSLTIANAKFKSRLGVLIDFGIIVEQDVIDSFPLGIINSHFSLLPEWRGADPITFSILSGQHKTGVSLMLLTSGMDEGPLLAVSEYQLPSTITTPVLTEKLIVLSNELLTTIIPKYVQGEVTATPQETVAARMGYELTPTYSRKLSKEDSILDWNKPAEQLEREIRAFAEWPKSRTILGEYALIITASHVLPGIGKPGDIIVEDKQLGVQTSDGVLAIDRLKPAGKQEMSAEAFLNGYNLS